MQKTGIYVHIPFCRSKCPYCDFYSLTDTAKAKQYAQALSRNIEKFFAENSCKADTLYIGGGTPSVLKGEQIAAIVKSAQKACGNTLSELTIECNPSDVNAAFFQEVFAAGVNRISFGMQSAVDSERRALGRRADRVTVENAVREAQQIGFSNISLDLMLGIPGQTKESLSESIRFAAGLGVQHISAYLLSIEEGTWFEKNLHKLHLPDEEATAQFYLQAVEELQAQGFAQYEISNFAKPGFESRHNLKYWRLEPYIGFGAAAHSFFNGKRFYYPRDIDDYLGGGAPIADGDGGSREERIMLGLRLSEGIALSLLSEKALARVKSLCEEGLATVSEEKLALTPEGFLLSNSIINLLCEE